MSRQVLLSHGKETRRNMERKVLENSASKKEKQGIISLGEQLYSTQCLEKACPRRYDRLRVLEIGHDDSRHRQPANEERYMLIVRPGYIYVPLHMVMLKRERK